MQKYSAVMSSRDPPRFHPPPTISGSVPAWN